ncbi:hypothetical protein DFH09DRAFT_1111792 [Mycena vulgaris]|nr:hypothetical protein DFH09DRAFT_1111792 [Mycena vulgaris]
MDGNHPRPPVTLVRAHTQRPPPLEIPSLDFIRARRISSSIKSPEAPSPLSASTLISLRAGKRSVWQKMSDVLRTYGFDSLDRRSKRHRQAVSALLQGQSKIVIAQILPLIFNHHKSRPKKNDADHSSPAISPYKLLSEIRYARLCIAAWATRLISDHIYYRVGKLMQTLEADVISERQDSEAEGLEMDEPETESDGEGNDNVE